MSNSECQYVSSAHAPIAPPRKRGPSPGAVYRCSECDKPGCNARRHLPLEQRSASVKAAHLVAETGISLSAAGRQFGVTKTAVWFAWRQLFGDRPIESQARRDVRNANIAALAGQGWTAQRLAAAYGLHHLTVKKIAKRLGSYARDQYNADPEALQSALRMVGRGVTYRDAAKSNGLGTMTVSRAARRAGSPSLYRKTGKIARAVELVDGGAKVADACKAVDCHAGAVYVALRRRRAA